MARRHGDTNFSAVEIETLLHCYHSGFRPIGKPVMSQAQEEAIKYLERAKLVDTKPLSEQNAMKYGQKFEFVLTPQGEALVREILCVPLPDEKPVQRPLVEYAFPHNTLTGQRGLTLRDYFAGQTLQGLAGAYAVNEQCADECYNLADAMLASREKA